MRAIAQAKAIQIMANALSQHPLSGDAARLHVAREVMILHENEELHEKSRLKIVHENCIRKCFL